MDTPGLLTHADQSTTAHRWKFIRTGGVLQVVFRTGADVINLDQLDQKLWVALASPTKNVEFDERTLEVLDIDKDGRIRAPEVIQTTRWLKDVLTNPNDLFKATDTVPLSAINNNTAPGAAILASFKRVIARSPQPDAAAISLAEITALTNSFATAKLNGDGIMPPDSAPDDDTKKAIEEIIATHGGVPDRSGKIGVNQAKVDAFFTDAESLLAWQKKSEADPAILPLADKTAPAAESVQALRTKINDYFARTQLATFDPRATPILNRAEAELIALAAKDLRPDAPEIAQLPLARIEPGRPLPLANGLNPAWSAAVTKFATNTVIPVLTTQRDSLTSEDWRAIQSKLSAYETWLASKPPTPVEKLGLPRLRQLLDSGVRAKLTGLISQDLAEAPTGDDFKAIEKLIRIHRDLIRFLNNFVSFSDFYSRRGAIFQAGTLYLDARSCELCVHVADQAKHALLAGLSKAYLAYCDCTRLGKKITIAAAFTAGDSDNLMVGRNGVFYDRAGNDWDATITKIVDNPISIRQAFWSPYKKFLRMVEEQVAKRAAAAEAASQAKLSTAATTVATADLIKPDPAAPPKPADPKKVDVGAVAALGVALGSLATFLGLMFTKVIDLGWWAPFAVAGIIFAISLPSMLIAWLKLRQRNLGPILDANGWAVNGRMKINVPFGGALSKTAKLPRNAQLQLDDPFYESHAGRYTVITLLVLAFVLGTLWRMAILDRFLPTSLKRNKPVIVVPGSLLTGAPALTTNITQLSAPTPGLPLPIVTNK
ncbi:MAG TPA: hypothetical protein VF773_17315 [Verrucomicrobiae bacterium]